MRRFVDLNLNLPLEQQDKAEEMLTLAASLGYSAAAVVTSTGNDSRVLQLRRKQGFETALRVNLAPSSPNHLLRELSRLRRKYEVIAVICREKRVTRQAAKDHRVDLLSFPSLRFRAAFDEAIAGMASKSNAALEVEVAHLLTVDRSSLPHNLSELRRQIKIAFRCKMPVVVSSGAREVYGLKAPRDLAALLMLLGVPEQNAISAVSKTPLGIIQRNRCKLSSAHVSPGVRVVRAGRGGLENG